MTVDGHAIGHKIPIPSNYRNAAKYLRQVVEQKKNIKTLLLNDTHFRLGRSIMYRILTNLPQINAIMKRIDLATKEPKMNEWLARVLIFELLFRRETLNGVSLPVECIRRYESDIRAAFEETKVDNPPIARFKDSRFVRINTSVLNLEGAKRLLQEEGWILVDEKLNDYQSFLNRVLSLGDLEYLVDFHFKDMLVFPNSAKGYWARAEHLRSKFFLQNKACLLATYLLKPSKKSVVLDMCSAPGMKATHLAGLMKNKGRLYAVERDAERYKLLCKYAAEFGVIKTILGDCLNITDNEVPGVQYILLDPSCSGSGMLNRLEVPGPVDPDRLFKLAGLQYKLLSHAMNAYPNAKRIVYSTCSLHTEENENVVMRALRHNHHFKLLDARKELGKEWFHVGSSEYPGVGERCLYARSAVDLTIGMFVAVFERCAEGEHNEIFEAYEKQKKSFRLNKCISGDKSDAVTNESVEGQALAHPGKDADTPEVTSSGKTPSKQRKRKNNEEPNLEKKKKLSTIERNGNEASVEMMVEKRELLTNSLGDNGSMKLKETKKELKPEKAQNEIEQHVKGSKKKSAKDCKAEQIQLEKVHLDVQAKKYEKKKKEGKTKENEDKAVIEMMTEKKEMIKNSLEVEQHVKASKKKTLKDSGESEQILSEEVHFDVQAEKQKKKKKEGKLKKIENKVRLKMMAGKNEMVKISLDDGGNAKKKKTKKKLNHLEPDTIAQPEAEQHAKASKRKSVNDCLETEEIQLDEHLDVQAKKQKKKKNVVKMKKAEDENPLEMMVEIREKIKNGLKDDDYVSKKKTKREVDHLEPELPVMNECITN